MLIKKQTMDLMAILLVILASGNPVISYLIGKESLLIGLPILLFFYGLVRGLRVKKNDWLIIFIFGLISLVHLMTFGLSVLPASLGFLLKISVALLIVRTVKDFPNMYVRLMYILAIISLVFFIPQVVLGDVLRSYVEVVAIPYSPGTLHIGLHNFNPEDFVYRNSGFFWEPGAYAGYLMLALIFSVGREIKSGKRLGLDKTSLVLLAALLTTQSTTGYAAMTIFAIAFVYFRYGLRHVGRMLLVSVVLLSIAYGAFTNLPFLSEKIEGQFEKAVNLEARSEMGRFGNALYDLESIKQRPLFGWSPYMETRSIVDTAVSDWVAGQGNGLTALIVRFGFAGLLFYVLLAYRTFFNLYGHVGYSVTSVVVVLMLLMGEQFLNFPLFMTLMFAGGSLLKQMHMSKLSGSDVALSYAHKQ